MSNYLIVLNSNQTALRTRGNDKRTRLNELIGDLGSISNGSKSGPTQNRISALDFKENSGLESSGPIRVPRKL